MLEDYVGESLHPKLWEMKSDQIRADHDDLQLA